MNASVQYITSPWSGHIWSPGASATGIQGGGAATPVLPGSGFSWATIVGSKVGGPVSTYLLNTRGVPMTASFVRRYPGGLRGLGAPCVSDPTLDCGDPGTVYIDSSGTPVSVPPTSASTPWFAPAVTAAATGGANILKQYVSYQNPLYQKQTVAFTPQGQLVLSTNQPSVTTAGAVASGLSNMMPMLMIGGFFFMMMMMAKR